MLFFQASGNIPNGPGFELVAHHMQSFLKATTWMVVGSILTSFTVEHSNTAHAVFFNLEVPFCGNTNFANW